MISADDQQEVTVLQGCVVLVVRKDFLPRHQTMQLLVSGQLEESVGLAPEANVGELVDGQVRGNQEALVEEAWAQQVELTRQVVKVVRLVL